MLIRAGQSERSTWLLVCGIVAVTLLLACIVAAVALSVVVIPRISGNGEADTPPPTRTVPDGEAIVSVLDVDQGQAVLIVAPDGSAALIDAGRSQTRIREEIAPYVASFGITTLDYLILSHPDQDHIGGMPAVLDEFDVATWVDPGIPTTNLAYEETINIVLDRGIPAIQAERGEVLLLGNTITLQLLWPDTELISSGSEFDPNENSTVVRVIFGETEILIPGDLEDRGEAGIVERYGAALESDILVVGHHGSNTSSTPDFLDAVNPEVAVISAGRDNIYGHPHDEVMQRLRFRSIAIYRTDLDGTIEIRTDGTNYSLETVETDTKS